MQISFDPTNSIERDIVAKILKIEGIADIQSVDELIEDITTEEAVQRAAVKGTFSEPFVEQDWTLEDMIAYQSALRPGAREMGHYMAKNRTGRSRFKAGLGWVTNAQLARVLGTVPRYAGGPRYTGNAHGVAGCFWDLKQKAVNLGYQLPVDWDEGYRAPEYMSRFRVTDSFAELWDSAYLLGTASVLHP